MQLLEALTFISSTLKTNEAELDKIHFYNSLLQCTDGIVTANCPCMYSYSFSTKGSSFIKAATICKGHLELHFTKKSVTLKNIKTSFSSRLQISKPPSKLKVKRKKEQFLPDDFIKKVKQLLKFTIKDSEHQWASSINVIGKYLYSTNNISIVRTKLNVKLKTKILPHPLLNTIIKIKEKPLSIMSTDRKVVIFYTDGAWVSCQKINEEVPDIGVIFDQFQKPTPMLTDDKKGLVDVLSMSENREILIKKGTILTDTCQFKNTSFSDTKVDADKLELLISLFNNVKFGKQMSFFKNEEYEAVLAGRM